MPFTARPIPQGNEDLRIWSARQFEELERVIAALEAQIAAIDARLAAVEAAMP